MNIYRNLDPAAEELAHQYGNLLDTLPRTFSTFLVTQLEKPSLFEPEKNYLRVLLEQLSAFSEAERKDVFGSLAAFEVQSGCDAIQERDPAKLDQLLIEHIKRRGLWTPWREQINQIFDRIEPGLDAQLYGHDHSHRLVVILYDQGITIERSQLWGRFARNGARVPLALGNALTTQPFLHELFTGQPAGAAEHRSVPTLFSALGQVPRPHSHDVWVIEASDSLLDLCQQGPNEDGAACLTGVSYALLRDYRQKLSDIIYQRTSTGEITGPEQLASYLRSVDITPDPGSVVRGDPLVQSFIREIFLGGAGCLVINNTFVEWASVQAMTRAQPHVLVARFGVRYKMKPFSSLLLFSKPRPTDKIPQMLDNWGSFVDVELLSYYIWLKSQELVPYRGDKTLYLLLADGVEEMLVVRGGRTALAGKEKLDKVTLSDVAATMAAWMGVHLPSSTGRVLTPLIS